MKQIVHFLLMLPVISSLHSNIIFANGEDTVAAKSAESISNDTVILFEENFDDGDFTNNPAWDKTVHQVCAPDPASIDVVDGALRLSQKNAQVCGNTASLSMALSIRVCDSTKIQFDVKPSYSTVDEGAGYANAEYPVSIYLRLLNQENGFQIIMFSYNYRGGASRYQKDNVRHAFPYCEKDKWIRNELYRIRDFFPDAKTILEIQVMAAGWDYVGWADNIKIFNSKRIIEGEHAMEVPPELVDFDTLSKTRHDKAIEMYRKNLRIAIVANSVVHQAAELRKIGWLHFQLSNYDSAMIYLKKAIIAGKKIADPSIHSSLSGSYNLLSKIYAFRNEYDSALFMLDTLFNIYQNTNDTIGITYAINERAEICFLTGDVDEAENCYREILKLNHMPKNTILTARTLQKLGDLYLHESKYQMALESYLKAHTINKSIGDLNSVAMLYLDIGNIYFITKKFDDAIENLNRSLKIAEIRNMGNLLSDIYLKISEIYLVKGDTALYYKYFSKYSTSRRLNVNRDQALTEQYVKYETEKKDQEIELLNKENEIKELKLERKTFQTYLFWSIFFLGLIVILIIYARYRLKQKANLLLAQQKAQLEKFNTALIEKNKLISGQKQEIEKQVKEKETMLRELHHRVKNNLQVIYSMLSLQADNLKDKDAMAAIEANIHRVWAMSLIHHKLYLDENLTQINMPQYLDELGSNILDTNTTVDQTVKLKYDIQDIDLEADIAIPLGLIINELLSNAFKHAFEGVSVPEVIIELREQSNQLILNIKDNGVGISKDAEPNKPGAFGLELINMLVRQLKGTLEVTNKNGTCFKLVLSLSETTHAEAIPSQIINQ